MNRRTLLQGGIAGLIGLGSGAWAVRSVPAQKEHYPDLIRTIWAIALVESGGDPCAVGKLGERGMLQILPDYWADGCRFLGVQWPYDDAKKPVKSLCVAAAYLDHYQQTRGYPACPETWSRLHNGGPRGPEKETTRPYWLKVQKTMSST